MAFQLSWLVAAICGRTTWIRGVQGRGGKSLASGSTAMQRKAQPTPGCDFVYTHGHVEVVRSGSIHNCTYTVVVGKIVFREAGVCPLLEAASAFISYLPVYINHE